MTPARIVPVLALGALLAACDGGHTHASCHDETTTRAHVATFQADLQKAVAAGRIPPEQMTALQAELVEGLGRVGSLAGGEACVVVDRLRQTYDL